MSATKATIIHFLDNSVNKTIIIAASFTLMYYHTILELARNWDRDPNFSHGYLIPFVCLFMLWHNKSDLKQTNIKPYNSGILIILSAALMLIIGTIGAETFSMRFSMILSIVGCVLFLFGKSMLIKVLLPILYLFFMIPIPKIIWNQIAFPLQLLGAKLSTLVIKFMGIPILREGNILHLSNTTLEVVDACSGLRSLTSLLALSGAFAYLSELRAVHKVVLFVSAVPIALVLNILRLTSTAVLAKFFGPEAAKGFLHEISGIIVFLFACFIIYGIKTLLQIIEHKFNKKIPTC